MVTVTLLAGCGVRSSEDELPAHVDASSPQLNDPALVARGAYIAKAGDCSACHDAADHTPLAGGLPVNSPLGPIYASNITPDPTFGIGRYTLRQFSDAVRLGRKPDGTWLYPGMPYPSFANMTDEDVKALYAYLMRSVKPAAKRTPETHLPFPFNQRWGMRFWSLAFGNAEQYSYDARHDAQWNRGAYLVQGLGHCGACHTPRGPAYNELGYSHLWPTYLTGALNDHWFAPNLTGDPGSGLGRWTVEDITAFLRSGHGANAVVFAAMAPVVEESTQYLSDTDLKAIAIYLKSLPGKRESGSFDANAHSQILTSRAIETGEVERPGAGVYLSFCARCHGADGRGQPGKYPALAGSPLVLGSDPTSVIRIVVEGSASAKTNTVPEQQKMPGFHEQLTTSQIAEVVSFIRNTWGNHAAPVSDRTVGQLRSAIRQ